MLKGGEVLEIKSRKLEVRSEGLKTNKGGFK